MEEDQLTFVVASDVHLGYGLRNPERMNDSFAALEEILAVAKQRSADFVLLGGDLFHDNKPARYTMHRAMELLRAYSLGDAPVRFDASPVSAAVDPLAAARTFAPPAVRANFLEPNFNVAVPVFSIHGNHDEPAGDGTLGDTHRQLAALDLLSVASLVNYFGALTEVDRPRVYPVLIRRGAVRLALYGLGAVRDEKLYQALHLGAVEWVRPPDDPDAPWLNLLVLHQNRVARTRKHGIPEDLLPDWLHLVLWGHEHECIPALVPSSAPNRSFRVLQPGSPTITSLCPAEAVQKQLFLFTLTPGRRGERCAYAMEALPLRSARPLEFADIRLAVERAANPADAASVGAVLRAQVEDMLRAAHARPCAAPGRKPLIRLRVEHSGFERVCPTPSAFGALFRDRVANPEDMILYYRAQDRAAARSAPRRAAAAAGDAADDDDAAAAAEVADPAGRGGAPLRDILSETLSKKDLHAVPARRFEAALAEFVDKEENSALRKLLDAVVSEVGANVRGVVPPHGAAADPEDMARERVIQWCAARSGDPPPLPATLGTAADPEAAMAPEPNPVPPVPSRRGRKPPALSPPAKRPRASSTSSSQPPSGWAPAPGLGHRLQLELSQPPPPPSAPATAAAAARPSRVPSASARSPFTLRKRS